MLRVIAKTIVAVVVFLLGFAAVTTPSNEDFPVAARAALIELAKNEKPSEGASAVEVFFKAGCKWQPEICVDLITAGAETRIENFVVFKIGFIKLQKDGPEASCLGLLNRWHCR